MINRSHIFDLCWDHLVDGEVEWARFELYVYLTRVRRVSNDLASSCAVACVSPLKIDFHRLETMLDRKLDHDIATRRQTEEPATR